MSYTPCLGRLQDTPPEERETGPAIALALEQFQTGDLPLHGAVAPGGVGHVWAGSTWYCELCRVSVWVAYVPKRLRHVVCRKWMTRVD
jgi:hypothetical protein